MSVDEKAIDRRQCEIGFEAFNSHWCSCRLSDRKTKSKNELCASLILRCFYLFSSAISVAPRECVSISEAISGFALEMKNETKRNKMRVFALFLFTSFTSIIIILLHCFVWICFSFTWWRCHWPHMYRHCIDGKNAFFFFLFIGQWWYGRKLSDPWINESCKQNLIEHSGTRFDGAQSQQQQYAHDECVDNHRSQQRIIITKKKTKNKKISTGDRKSKMK